MNMRENVDFVLDQVREHTDWFGNSLPMIASENVMSPLAKKVYNSDFMDRYAEGLPHNRYYEGNIYVDEVEDKCTELAKKLYGAKFSEVRPVSATTANMAIMFAFAKPGDKVTAPKLSDGAHISTAKFGAFGVRGVTTKRYPFDQESMNLDVDGTCKLIREEKPSVAMFGQSVFLFPNPLTEIKDAIEEVGAVSWYDGAHVMGLIAGKQFQDPLKEGITILSGSTHKTLPGPQHGLILTNTEDDEFNKKIQKAVFPGVTSNHHLHAMAALTVTLAEAIEFGEEYASQIVRNAQALGQAMHDNGFDVLGEKMGFTRSHTLSVRVVEQGGGADVSKKLERSNVIANKNLLPEDKSPINPSGIRLGVQELTRCGMKESEMKQVADIFKRLLIDGGTEERAKEEVIELRRNFNTVQYCFDAGKPGYVFD